MDSRAVRKRPWEEDDPMEYPLERRLSTTAGQHTPPLPQPAGIHTRDSQALSYRRLPPLYTPICGASTEAVRPNPLQLSTLVQNPDSLDESRPRSQSLFDVFQQSKRPRHASDSEAEVHPDTLDSHSTLPSIGTNAGQPSFSIDPTSHAAGSVSCCSADCNGNACSRTRSLIRRLATELTSLDAGVRAALHKEHQSSIELPEFDIVNTEDSLQWALERVRWNNMHLREYLDDSAAYSPDPSSLQPDPTAKMRRAQQQPEREEQSPPMRHYAGPASGYSGFTHVSPVHEDTRRNLQGNDYTPIAGSPHHTASSSGSVFAPPRSPMQAPQVSRPYMLPSPSSMNFPAAMNQVPTSPPNTAAQSSAQSAHLQDLQHQVSIKTLAFQTLQREYDSLIQKLERQRTKCATLEKKFEVSDVEINTLTDEKEKLQSQVSALERQAEELQQSRDEARRQLVANGAQYMRIMEMANRLQAQSADDKKRWESEKSELEQRIRLLEEAMVTGQSIIEQSNTVTATSHSPSMTPTQQSQLTSSDSNTSTETMNVLRAEIGRLRTRTQTLEAALQAMKNESISIQLAVKQLIDSGGKIEQAVESITST
ncbi:hypothetical protein K491DRAFT_86223 [Lophiostoma macrostomum CBS 122681]|uniref:Uncharacterized protein n=1 Tax=Lophiostoma macrostomum CBS 122681 TaxID=1314788 RepID=A0A6A6SV69_9PLEO|nr:hypothetical protein K491DRAFT_86223 [Lophiostoma macrostomum CBS 122681]